MLFAKTHALDEAIKQNRKILDMVYNPSIHHRRSIRLKGYDYSQAGLYFITICTQNRKMFFGKIDAGKLILNDAGIMIEKWYWKLEEKFPDIKCDTMVVMPNHFHCIIENTGVNIGADLRVCPYIGTDNPNIPGEHGDSDNPNIPGEHGDSDNPNIGGEHGGSPLRRVVQWFKTMTTNEYIRGVKTLDWPRFDGKLWQRNYYEHIIRDEKSYQNISNYIINNPANWKNNKHHHPPSD